MTKRSPEQVYALLRQAGFGPEAATTMTAIAGGESGWDDANLGDVSLQNATWGPSYGLFQIRTQKAATGTGGNRDQLWLAASDLNQAKAAYAISSGGTDFSPWTVFNTGKYQQFKSQAIAAAKAVGENFAGVLAGISGAVGGAAGAVGQAAGGVLDTVLTPLLEGGRQLALTGAFALLGAVLLVGGLYLTARPSVKASERDAKKAVVKVAKAVV